MDKSSGSVDPAQPFPSDARSQLKSYTQPWFTMLAIVICVVVHIGVTRQNKEAPWLAISNWGYASGSDIWDGNCWALISSAFVHADAWHLLLNLYWLWVLGSVIERAIGFVPFAIFYTVAAFVSSSMQLILTDDAGIGASGVVYSIFGFMWIGRYRYREFFGVLTPRIIALFLLWLIACFVLTYFKILYVANIAHVFGLIFGCMVGAIVAGRLPRRIGLSCLAAMLVASVAPLYWCPWSVTWLINQAYTAHDKQRYQEAIALYSKIIGKAPDNAWAYCNRSRAYQALGDSEKANADLNAARKLDPKLVESP